MNFNKAGQEKEKEKVKKNATLKREKGLEGTLYSRLGVGRRIVPV